MAQEMIHHRATVWAVTTAGLSPASRAAIETTCGTIIPLVQAVEFDSSNHKSLGKLAHHLMTKLIETKEEDFLLVRGNNLIVTMAVSMWLTMHRKVNILCVDDKSPIPMHIQYDQDVVRLEIEQLRDRIQATKEAQQ